MKDPFEAFYEIPDPPRDPVLKSVKPNKNDRDFMALMDREAKAVAATTLLSKEDRAGVKRFAEDLVKQVKSRSSKSVKAARVRAEMAHVLFSHLNAQQRDEYACHQLVCGDGGKPSPLCALFPVKRPVAGKQNVKKDKSKIHVVIA